MLLTTPIGPVATDCVAQATMGGERSYTDLLTCLEIARDVKKMNPQ